MPQNHGFSLINKSGNYGNKFYGKYRGIVTSTKDPLSMGRIRGVCPKVLGPSVEVNWALPAFPPNMITIPKDGDLVWFEFEEGDPTFPVWTGVWFSEGKLEDKNELLITKNVSTIFGNSLTYTHESSGQKLVRLYAYDGTTVLSTINIHGA